MEQRSDTALVIDLDGLLCRRRMVAGRGRLEHEPVYGGEDEQLADQPRHCGILAGMRNPDTSMCSGGAFGTALEWS